MSRSVHLVGSVPLANSREVFKTVSAVLGPRLRRIPDGETGERTDWVSWQRRVFAEHPAFEPTGRMFHIHPAAPGRMRYRLKSGVSASEVSFDNLYYADVAEQSYREFARLKQANVVPEGCRFQVALAPAHSVLWLFVEEELHEALDPIYNEALAAEIDKLGTRIPLDELAIQLDVASAVFARLQRNEPSAYGRNKEEMFERFGAIITRLGDRVPAGAELLLHFCYGDAGHRHVVEPVDTGDMVRMANRLTRTIRRPIDLIHMPVPRDRSDDAYFEPLRNLDLGPQPELSLGLVHYTDGVPGTRKRLATAEKFVTDFSIATECGFGRRPPATVPELLRIHVEAAG